MKEDRGTRGRKQGEELIKNGGGAEVRWTEQMKGMGEKVDDTMF